MRRWLIPIWSILLTVALIATALLAVDLVRTRNDTSAARRRAASVEASRQKLDAQRHATERQLDALIATAKQESSHAAGSEAALNGLVSAFDAYLRAVQRADDTRAARIAALNRAVAAENSGDKAGARQILTHDVTAATAAASAALATEEHQVRILDAALAHLRGYAR
jgi:hypothetical protein